MKHVIATLALALLAAGCSKTNPADQAAKDIKAMGEQRQKAQDAVKAMEESQQKTREAAERAANGEEPKQ